MATPYQLKGYYDDEDMADFESQPEIHNFRDVEIEPRDLILLPKFRYVRNADFQLSKDDLLLSREAFLENIAHIDRWYIYLLFDLLTSSETDRNVVEAAWQLMYALDRELDQDLGRKEPLLDLDSEKEFPLMRRIYNACYGDYPIPNNRAYEPQATFFVSYRLPWSIMSYLAVNPFTGELNVEQVKNYMSVTSEVNPVPDLYNNILSFLGINVQEPGPEGKEAEIAWPQYDTVDEYVNARIARDNLAFLSSKNAYNAYQNYITKFKIGSLEELVAADTKVQNMFRMDDVPSTEYFNTLLEYFSLINRTTRFLLIGPAQEDTLDYSNVEPFVDRDGEESEIIESVIETINLDDVDPLAPR